MANTAVHNVWVWYSEGPGQPGGRAHPWRCEGPGQPPRGARGRGSPLECVFLPLSPDFSRMKHFFLPLLPLLLFLLLQQQQYLLKQQWLRASASSLATSSPLLSLPYSDCDHDYSPGTPPKEEQQGVEVGGGLQGENSRA